MYVSIEELRRHLNIPFYDDDLLLGEYEEAAEAIIEKHINCSLSKYVNSSNELDAGLKIAIKTLVANFYANREPVSFGQVYKVPFSIEYALQGYKNYVRE